jgi:Tfp pilus assembly protein PilX
MDLGWMLLVIVGSLLIALIVITLMRMAGDQDREARHEQKRLDPFSEVTITRPGDG